MVRVSVRVSVSVRVRVRVSVRVRVRVLHAELITSTPSMSKKMTSIIILSFHLFPDNMFCTDK